MIDIKQLKEIALANVVDPTNEYYYRYICRWYSKTFHTPLHEVFTLPFQDVILAYFEEGYESMEEEDRFEDMMRAVDPDFDAKEEEAIQEFISMIEEEEENKRRAKAERDKAKNFLHKDASTLDKVSENSTESYPSSQKTSSSPHSSSVAAESSPAPQKEVVRRFVDDTPEDEVGDLGDL
jgi:primosomal protein N'